MLTAALPPPLRRAAAFISDGAMLAVCLFIVVWGTKLCIGTWGQSIDSLPWMPVGLTYAVEKTHPVPEATSNGILMLSGQVSGILLALFFNLIAIAILFVVGLIFTLLMKEIAPRRAAAGKDE